MPVILAPEAWQAWLGEELADEAQSINLDDHCIRLLEILWRSTFPHARPPKAPAPPAGVFNLARCFAARTLVGKKTRLIPGSRVGDRQGHADCERGELINRVPAGAPVRQFLFVELLGHARVPFARYWPDHPRGGRVRRNRHASCSGSGGRPRTRGGRLRVIPVLLVRSNGGERSSILCRQTVRPACILPGETG